jgi:hypothetical protein
VSPVGECPRPACEGNTCTVGDVVTSHVPFSLFFPPAKCFGREGKE